MHLAANSLVGESMVDPAKYCRSNVVDAVALLEVCREEGVRVHHALAHQAVRRQVHHRVHPAPSC
ncbi:MAG: GDP-mannose 4,6-dehydratase, partial [Candidatus Desulforudis sp.]|nr:GDP-mannose 4,6-dehydratase [Desulforudis sp.]